MALGRTTSTSAKRRRGVKGRWNRIIEVPSWMFRIGFEAGILFEIQCQAPQPNQGGQSLRARLLGKARYRLDVNSTAGERKGSGQSFRGFPFKLIRSSLRRFTTRGKAMRFGKTIPIFRIFDEAKAREFDVDFLGFTVDWEHRFEPNTPLYMQVSKGQCFLHLSEHHGDCSPGSAIRIETADIDAFHADLASKDYKYARPGINEPPWGTREVSVHDPFGNRLTFTTS